MVTSQGIRQPPAQLPQNPLAHYDFTDLSSLFQDVDGLVPVTRNGQNIARVNNKVTSTLAQIRQNDGFQLIQNSNGRQPAWNSDQFQGYGGAFFSGNKFLSNTVAQSVGEPWTAIAIAKTNRQSDTDPRVIFGTGTAPNENALKQDTLEFTALSATSGLKKSGFSDDEFHLMSFQASDGARRLVVDREAPVTDANNVNPLGDDWAIGALSDNSQNWIGVILEVAVWNSLLNDATIEEIRNYVEEKYGV
jgi:hypothetical protein